MGIINQQLSFLRNHLLAVQPGFCFGKSPVRSFALAQPEKSDIYGYLAMSITFIYD